MTWLPENEARARELDAKATKGPWECDLRVGVVAIYPRQDTESGHLLCLDKELGIGEWAIHWKIGINKPGAGWVVKEEDARNAEMMAESRTLLPLAVEEIARLRGQVKAMEDADGAELAALRADKARDNHDKERIDWLSEHAAIETVILEPDNYYKSDVRVHILGFIDCVFHDSNLREAIDAARASEDAQI